MKIYVDKLMSGVAALDFLRANLNDVNMFASLLVEIGSVYKVPASVLHIFYDKAGPTIAFNKGGALFFNLRFFLQLHAAGLARGGDDGTYVKFEAAAWWWVTMAHELAHNLVSTHGAEHSYYT